MIRMWRALLFSVCDSCTLKAEWQGSIQALETRCHWNILGIPYVHCAISISNNISIPTLSKAIKKNTEVKNGMSTPLSRREESYGTQPWQTKGPGSRTLHTDLRVNPSHVSNDGNITSRFQIPKIYPLRINKVLPKEKKKETEVKNEMGELEDHSQRLRHRRPSTIYRRSWSGALMRSDYTTKPGFSDCNDHITCRVEIPTIYPLRLYKVLPKAKEGHTEVNNEMETPMSGLGDHSKSLKHWHATKIFGSSWSGTLLCRYTTINPGHGTNDENITSRFKFEQYIHYKSTRFYLRQKET